MGNEPILQEKQIRKVTIWGRHQLRILKIYSPFFAFWDESMGNCRNNVGNKRNLDVILKVNVNRLKIFLTWNWIITETRTIWCFGECQLTPFLVPKSSILGRILHLWFLNTKIQSSVVGNWSTNSPKLYYLVIAAALIYVDSTHGSQHLG